MGRTRGGEQAGKNKGNKWDWTLISLGWIDLLS